MGIFILCLVLSFSVLGCDVVYRFLDKEGSEEKELVGEVTFFERNPTVEEIQSLLKIYGYDPGAIDGILGTRTRRAIERFQKDNGLKITRFADQETWKKLRIFTDNQLVVDKELNVTLIQTILKRAEFDPGQIDGTFGSKTKAAVKKFQAAHELKVDGKVGYKTLSKMALYLPLE